MFHTSTAITGDYTRTEEGKQYPIYCRKRGTLDGEEHVTLDLNVLSRGHKFLGLGLYKVSDDGNLLAYSLDTTGFRDYRCSIKDLRTGENLPESFEHASSAEWSADNKNLFFVCEDQAKRPYRVFRHRLGVEHDDLIYEENDELYKIWVYRSSDHKYLFLASESSVTSEVRYLESAEPAEEFKLLLKRETDHGYSVDHREGLFYIRTNKNAKNFRLVTVPVENPEPPNWKEIIPHRPDTELEGLSLFKNHAVFSERKNALNQLRVLDFRTGEIREIGFPEPVYAAFPSTNPEFDTLKFRYSYQSFITPTSTFEYRHGFGKKYSAEADRGFGGISSGAICFGTDFGEGTGWDDDPDFPRLQERPSMRRNESIAFVRLWFVWDFNSGNLFHTSSELA